MLLHFAILRRDGVVVPADLRAEWRGELGTCGDAGATRFCFGGLSRRLLALAKLPGRRAPLPFRVACTLPDASRRIGSVEVAGSATCARRTCGAGASRIVESFKGFSSVTGLAGLIVAVTSRLSLREYPATANSPSRLIRFRRWLFLATKFAMLLPIIYACGFAVFAIASRIDHVVGIVINLVVWCAALAFHWVLRDQRRRCPVCLRLLADPVRVGRSSGYFLEWNCMELVCF